MAGSSDYGIVVKNKEGKVNIDGNYKNFTYLESGNIAVPGTLPGRSTVTFTTAQDQPVLCAVGLQTDVCVSVSMVTKSGDNYTNGKFWVAKVIASPTSTTIPYLAMKRGRAGGEEEKYGLKVWNKDDELVFTSFDRNLVVRSMTTFTHNFSSGYKHITVEDAANNYFLLYPWYWHFTETNIPPETYRSYSAMMYEYDSTTVSILQTLIESKAGGTGPAAAGSGSQTYNLWEFAVTY